MKKISPLLVLLFLFLMPLSQAMALGSDGNFVDTCYVSSSEGSDSNIGTIDAPRKTISGLPSSAHRRRCILLKRGDVFYDHFTGFHDCYIGAYGDGDAPVVSGFRVLVNPLAWEKVAGKSDVWSLDLTNNNNFIGIDESFQGRKSPIYNTGCIYLPQLDSIMGRMVNSLDKLAADGDFYTTSYFSTADLFAHPIKKVYLKMADNPGALGIVCFSTYMQGIQTVLNSTVENIDFVGYSLGAAGSSIIGTVVRNCSFDIIGGSVCPDSNPEQGWTRFGNGVEIWASTSNDILIDNCSFCRVYDAATTIQGSGGNPTNVRFINNRISRCRQAFEYWLRDGCRFINCEFSNNVSYMMGDNGFSDPKPFDCDIISYNQNYNADMNVRFNMFYGAPFFFVHNDENLPGLSYNMVYLYDGQYVTNKGWYDIGFVPSYSIDKFTKNHSGMHMKYVTPGSDFDLRMRRNIEAIINYHPPRLKFY